MAQASITIAAPAGAAFSAGALNGHYVFSYRGTAKDLGGTLVTVGYVDADGAGKLTGQGVANAPGFGTSAIYYTGTYLVYADGHGTAWMDIWDHPNSVILRSTRLDLQVVSNSLARIAAQDLFNVGAGALERQDSVPPSSAYTGQFVFGLDGDDSTYPLSVAGRFALGSPVNGTSTFSNGVIDVNDGGQVATALSLSGSVTPQLDGHAFATLNFPPYQITFELYPVSADRFVAMSMEPTVHLTGYVERQAAMPASLNGTYAIRGSAGSSSTPLAIVGLLHFDGAGSIAGKVSQNDSEANGGMFSGSHMYSNPDASGHSTFQTIAKPQISLRTMSAYWASAQKAYWLQTAFTAGTALPLSGVLQSQTADTYDSTTVQGNFQLSLSGTHSGNPTTTSAATQISGTTMSGLMNRNDNFVLDWDSPFSGGLLWSAFSLGSWSASSATFYVSNPGSWSVYAISRDDLVVYGSDSIAGSNELVTGTLTKAQPPALGASANLSLSVAVSDAPSVAGYITFTATLVNNGPGTATGVWLADSLPATLGMVAPPITKGHCGDTVMDNPWLGGHAPTLYCNIGSLAPGEQVTWTLTTAATQAETVTNVMQAALNESDPDASDNSVYTTLAITNPVPVLSFINPQHIAAGSSAFSLGVSGHNFVHGAIVVWNGIPHTPSEVYENVMWVPITATDVANQGTVEVLVLNPGPGGGYSAPVSFTVDPKPPVQFSTTTLNFNAVMFYSVSAPQVVKVTNNQSVLLNFTNIWVPADFVYSTDCETLQPGESCTVAVWWRPTCYGQQYSMSIYDDGPGGEQAISLQGYPVDYSFWLNRPSRTARSSTTSDVKSNAERDRNKLPE